MTFTEAAAQVLRLVGKPLHYKEITDVAIEKDLLSHVGKSPEVTMGARLAALVKKGEKDNPLVRIKPGVFALREWDKATIDKGLADRTPAMKRLEARAAEGTQAAEGADEEEPSDASAAEAAPEPSSPSDARHALDDEELAGVDDELRERAELAAGASQLFAAEDDDDEPILGNGGDDDDADRGEDGGTRRRRRRRRRRGAGNGGDDLPGYTVSDAPATVAEDLDAGDDAESAAETRRRDSRGAEAREARGGEGREARGGEGREARGGEGRGGEGREGREGRGGEGRGGEGREGRGGRGREGRGRGGEGREARESRGGEGREGRESRGGEGREGRESRGGEGREGRESRGGEPQEELSGADLADAIAGVFRGFERGGAIPLRQLADAAKKRVQLPNDGGQAPGLLFAAMRADNLRRAAAGQRPRFRLSGGRAALWDWSLDGESRRLEQELAVLTGKLREASRKALLGKLAELPVRTFGELVTVVLERSGVTGLAPVKLRGGNGSGELHFSGRLRGAATDLRLAIVVRKEGRDLGRERVNELRGTLHHYDGATAGWILTPNQVLSGAREEAAVPGAAPVRLVDGAELARLCEEFGIGVVPMAIQLSVPDLELFEGLRS